MAFAAKLCTSSDVKLLPWLPDWLPTTYSFCCETLHQFWCETFMVIAWLTAYDLWLLLRNFAPVLVWNFYGAGLTAYDLRLLRRNFPPVLVWNVYGDCLTDCVQLMAFAAKLCTSSGVKLLRWLPVLLPTTYAAFAAKLCTSLLRWLSDDVALWLIGYRKNEWEISNSRWQSPTSAEKEHVISLALKSKGCYHSIFENTESIAFYTATERSLFALRR